MSAAMSEEEVQAMIDAVGVEAVDDYSVKFTLVEPAPYFPSDCQHVGCIPHAARSDRRAR